MNDIGWIKVSRNLPSHWIYQDKVYDKAHAWIDLIMLAEYKTHKKVWRGTLTEFKRGDVCLSISALAKRWGWSREKTKHFLAQLEADGMVRIKATVNRTTVTLVNYGIYQDRHTVKPTTKPTTNLTTKPTTDHTYLKNIKKDKERKEEPSAISSDEPDVETWNGKPIDELSDAEWVEYVNSWED